MQKIIPHLWFDKEAKQAAGFHTKVFPGSKVTSHYVMTGTPSGDCDVMSFDILGLSMMSISAGPYFKINPSISFMVNFDSSKDKDAKKHLDEVWAKLSEGGKVLMPLERYPFSEWYGWVEDRYGVSWQLILTDPMGQERPCLIPSMLFTGDASGKAEEATDYYISVFKGAKQEAERGTLVKYPADPTGRQPQKEGDVMFTDFKIGGVWMAAMDGGKVHEFGFNEAVSYMVNCDTQEEIDYYWGKLSHVPGSEMCGWCKDRWGVSWQIVPSKMEDMIRKGTPEQAKRVTEAFLKMKKFDLAALERAFAGK